MHFNLFMKMDYYTAIKKTWIHMYEQEQVLEI